MKNLLSVALIVLISALTSCQSTDQLYETTKINTPQQLQFVQTDNWRDDRFPMAVPPSHTEGYLGAVGNQAADKNNLYYSVNYEQYQGTDVLYSEIIKYDKTSGESSVIYSTDNLYKSPGIGVVMLIDDQLFWVEGVYQSKIRKLSLTDLKSEIVDESSPQSGRIANILYWYFMDFETSEPAGVAYYDIDSGKVVRNKHDDIKLWSPFERVKGYQDCYLYKTRQQDNILVDYTFNVVNTANQSIERYKVSDTGAVNVAVNEDYIVWCDQQYAGNIHLLDRHSKNYYRLWKLNSKDNLREILFFDGGIACDFGRVKLDDKGEGSHQLVYIDIDKFTVERLIDQGKDDIYLLWPSVSGNQLIISDEQDSYSIERINH